MQSKFLNQFKKLTNGDGFELIGDFILVERIPEEEKKTKSGIVLAATPSTHKDFGSEPPVFCHVLMVGKGFYDEETDKVVEINVNPGDIVLISPMSAHWFKSFGNLISEGTSTLGLIRESEIKMRFFGAKGYEQFFEILEKHVQE